MSDVKQVKVDNWGIYFLQRLKHFFNRTDYCDLTLQFQDNAQLKVHRLVLNACTEYFELLERTCEMYEDCLVMPEDLQADVVVPIVNFMYTGQLEFRMDALERLYQTSQVMNMPVLSKLLEAHRDNRSHMKNSHNFGSMRKYSKGNEGSRQQKFSSLAISSSSKRSYNKAFESHKSLSSKIVDQRRSTSTKITEKSTANAKDNEIIIYRDKKLPFPQNQLSQKSDNSYRVPSPVPLDSTVHSKKSLSESVDPRPTRYELPEDLDTDNIFDNSFSNISYSSQPLVVHPETTKQYSAKKSFSSFNEPTTSKKSFTSTVDIVECKKISAKDTIFDDEPSQHATDDDLYQSAFLSMKDTSPKDPGQLFDQIIENNDGPKVTIESKDKQVGNLDHAKIISEVLKKYPHLVKSNKNIKLKILNTPTKAKKTPRTPIVQAEEIKEKPKGEVSYTYETDVLDSKEAAKLISMGAENIKGPWICLICGTPGRALNFTSYYNFRRHLVEVHKEKPVSTICEYCGVKSHKRNYLLHHIYTKHGVPPPPQYNFPKCPMCDYIALTEGFLVKHKLTHKDFKTAHCVVCLQGFSSSNQLLMHIQKTGHKQLVQLGPGEKKLSIQCTYCMKVFLRDSNFYCHLKTSHKEQAISDGLIEDSDDEKLIEEKPKIMHNIKSNIKHENISFANDLEEEEDIQYQIQKRQDTLFGKKLSVGKNINIQQKILNSGFVPPVKQIKKAKVVAEVNNEFIHEIDNQSQNNEENIVVINDIEYIMKDNQLIPRKSQMRPAVNEEYILSDFMPQDEPEQRLQNLETVTPTTSMDVTNIHSAELVQQPKMILKKSSLNQPIQIVVSNEEEYKALMASNHSIIFDDGDSNKTLTVLTTPQNASLSTTGIDLGNTQPNENMMILQEDYPLNVSEAVTADNSKYVVVYSHAMDQNDPTKQFQIITPQEIGGQYIQSSAVITQNYDTIATSTAMVNANVLTTEIEEAWPQNDQQNVDQSAMLVESGAELQSITETEQTNINKNDVNSIMNIAEEEIENIPPKPTIVQLEQMQESIHNTDQDTENITHIGPEEMTIDDSQQNNIEEAMSVEIPTEAVGGKEDAIAGSEISAEQEIEAECQENMSIDNLNEQSGATLSDQDLNTAPQDQNQEENGTESAPLLQQSLSLTVQEKQALVPTSVDYTQETQDVNEESQPEMESNSNQEDIVPDAPTVIENSLVENEIIGEESNAEGAKAPVVETKAQIENLTSEWSEDEYDTVQEGPENNVTNKESLEEPELEESIENIQQEVQKQIGEESGTDITETFSSENAEVTNINESYSNEPNTETGHVEATQEKISSLLNDWEDNDSQEGKAAINENGDDSLATEDCNKNVSATNDDPNDVIKTNIETKKDDNIKSLVSDWDDEEEENK